jgi:hypothetical protein
MSTVLTTTITNLASNVIPNPTPQCPTQGFCNAAGTFLGFVEWGGIILGVVAMMVAGIMLYVQGRNPDGPMGNVTGFLRVVFGVGIVVAAAGIVGVVVTSAQS